MIAGAAKERSCGQDRKQHEAFADQIETTAPTSGHPKAAQDQSAEDAAVDFGVQLPKRIGVARVDVGVAAGVLGEHGHQENIGFGATENGCKAISPENKTNCRANGRDQGWGRPEKQS